MALHMAKEAKQRLRIIALAELIGLEMNTRHWLKVERLAENSQVVKSPDFVPLLRPSLSPEI